MFPWRTSAAFGLGHRLLTQFLVVLQPHQRKSVLLMSKTAQEMPVPVAAVGSNHFGTQIPACQSLHLLRRQLRIRTLGSDPLHIRGRNPGGS